MKSTDEWTPATNLPPTSGQRLLVVAGGEVREARYQDWRPRGPSWDAAGSDGLSFLDNVTHWRPMPLPPKGTP